MIGKTLEDGRRECGMCSRPWKPRSWKHYRCSHCGCHDDELREVKDRREANGPACELCGSPTYTRGRRRLCSDVDCGVEIAHE